MGTGQEIDIGYFGNISCAREPLKKVSCLFINSLFPLKFSNFENMCNGLLVGGQRWIFIFHDDSQFQDIDGFHSIQFCLHTCV